MGSPTSIDELLDRMTAVLGPMGAAGDPAAAAGGAAWRNARVLSSARRQSPEALASRIEELGRLSAARVEDLRRPGQVILRLSRHGFGVLLEGA